MAYILCIETSTTICSVALTRNGEVVAARQENEGNSHANRLTVLTEELFKDSSVNIEMSDIDAVAVSSGPGSYTGLRIGVSTAKGICFALGKPLIAIPSLSVLALPVVQNLGSLKNNEDAWFCPMIDARRMEVFSMLLDETGKIIKPISADIIDHTFLANELNDYQIVFFGNGSEKCRKVLLSENAVFLNNISASAKHMCELAWQAYIKNQFEDVAYFEPFYLKDFVATVSKKNMLG